MTSNLPSLRFHNVHSRNINHDANSDTACRNGFPDGLAVVFSDRPVLINERIKIKILDVENPDTKKEFIFGFTTTDPASLLCETHKSLKYFSRHFCSDCFKWDTADNSEFNILFGSSLKHYIKRDGILSFRYNESGNICYEMYQRDFNTGIPVVLAKSLWFFVALSEDINAIRLISKIKSYRKTILRNHEGCIYKKDDFESISSKLQKVDGVELFEDSSSASFEGSRSSDNHKKGLHARADLRGNQSTETSQTSDKLRTGSALLITKTQNKSAFFKNFLFSNDLKLPTICFHRVLSRNLKLTLNNRAVLRNESRYGGSTMFSDRPVIVNERIIIKILDSGSSDTKNTVKYGFTTTNPDSFLCSHHKSVKSVRDTNCLDCFKWDDKNYLEVNFMNSLNLKLKTDMIVSFHYEEDGYTHYNIYTTECAYMRTAVDLKKPQWFFLRFISGISFVILMDENDLDKLRRREEKSGDNSI